MCQTLSLIPGRWVPLAGLRTSKTGRGAVRNLDSTCEVQAHPSLFPKQGWVSSLRLPGTLASFPWHPTMHPGPHRVPTLAPLALWGSIPLGWRLLLPGGMCSCGGRSWLIPGTTSEWVWSDPSWHSWRQQIRSGLELWMLYGTNPVQALACTGCLIWPLLLRLCFHLELRCQCWGQWGAHT